MRFRNDDLLLYIAMADAYAAGAEYARGEEGKRAVEECLKFERYVPHASHGIPAGNYTDDTEMSVANTLVLLEEPPFTPEKFADAYVSEFNFGGKRKGYSRLFQTFLENIKNGSDFLSRIEPSSTKNGAAMRAVPIGVLPWVGDVLKVAHIQAAVTHKTPEGIFSAQAVALMSHYALYESGPLSDISEFCRRWLSPHYLAEFGYIFSGPWPANQPVTSYGNVSVAVATVHAVVHLLKTQKNLMGILEQTIRWGGDTDSVAAIAWGIASSRYHGEKIPEFLILDLETENASKTGLSRLRGLGTALMEKYSTL